MRSKVYIHKILNTQHKLGPTGKPRGSLDSSKLLKTFDFTYKYKDYESTIKDYYGKYENFCQKQ